MDWPSRLGVGRRANNSTLEKTEVQKRQQLASDMDGTLRKRHQLRDKDLRFGTWNIRTLAVPGKIDILSEELEAYNIDIAAVQESKWPFCGKLNTESYQILYSGCDDGRHYAGVGFAIKKVILGAVIDFKAISERLCYLRLKGRFNNISIVNIYAPTEEKEDDEKDVFYAQLEEVVTDLPGYDTKIILGDANAKVGREDIWRNVAGRESLHQTSNDNGTRLLSFANSLNLFIASTKFPHKNKHKQTWISPDGRTANQIDHVLVDKRHLKSVLDVRSLRGAECGTDHYLVILKMRQKLKIEKINADKVVKKTVFETNKIKEFQIATSNRFLTLSDITEVEEEQDPKEHIENSWNVFKKSIKEAAKEVFTSKKNTKKPWFNKECKVLVDQRKKAKLLTLSNPTPETKQEYKNINKQVNKTLRKEKRLFIENTLRKAEEDSSQNNAKEFYRKVRFFQKGYKPKIIGMKDKSGKTTCDKTKVLSIWKDYFEELLNAEETREEEVSEEEAVEEDSPNNDLRDNLQHVQEPTKEEIIAVLKTFKNDKAPGEDGIPIELLKHGSVEVTDYLYNLIISIWKTEIMPEEWTGAVVVPVHKKGDKLDCKNYRGISLLNTTYKVLSKLILNRLKQYAEEIIGDHQAGFMKERSTMDQIFILKELASKYWEYNKDLYIVFIDFKKAYDSIKRTKIWYMMKRANIPKKLIDLTKMCINKSKGKVKVENEYTETFYMNTGVKQGDGLSPLLFNIVVEEAMKKTRNRPEGVKINGNVNLLAFADDVAIIAEKKEDLNKLTEQFLTDAKKVGLQVNEDKTQYMKISRRGDLNPPPLRVLNYNFKYTEEFKYLGVAINSTNQEDTEIQHRLTAADRSYWSLAKLLKNKILSKRTKIRIYKTMIQPVLVYGSEVWALTKKSKRKMITFENKILRRIFGPTKEGEMWRIRKNRELRELYKEPDIVAIIRSRRLRWLGHIIRRNEDRTIKKVWTGRPEGTRPLGRPRMRWNDQIRIDLEKMGAEMEQAQDRREWRRLVGEAKTLLGFEWPQE